jgi:hypothetical protein
MSAIEQKPQYSKFEYKDFDSFFGEHVIISSPPEHVQDEMEREKDRLINEVITEHFSEKLPETAPLDEFHIEENIQSFEVPHEAALDIEAVKTESYQKGYNDAKNLFEGELQARREDSNLESLLKSKLESITSALDLENQVFRLASNVLAVIAKKLHLMVPADFETVILGEMVPLLSKYYKIGSIILTVNPDKVDYCKNLFKIGSLPHHISENIVVNADESMAKDSCSLKWNDTSLEYNQEELVLDIEKILDHLKIEVNN